MGKPTFDILWKPPPPLVHDKENYRWFYRVCECLNGGVPGTSTVLSVPYSENTSGTVMSKGSLVGYAGVSNGTMDLRLFIANGSQSPYSVLGVLSSAIGIGESGYAVYYGEVTGIDTSAWVAGSILYASATAPGGITAVMPYSPDVTIVVGTVLTQSVHGSIFVRIYPQLRSVYGNFVNATAVDQPVGNVTVSAVNWGVAIIARGVHLDPIDATKIVVETSGLYTLSHSLELFNNNNTSKIFMMWLRINGVNRAGTTRNTGITDSGIPITPVWSYTLALKAGDVVQYMMKGTDIGMYLHTTPTSGVSPNDVPSAASAAISVMQVSQ